MKDLTLDVLFATLFGRELAVDGDGGFRRAADGLNGRFSPESWVLPEWVPTPNRWRFDRLDGEVSRLLAAEESDECLLPVLASARDGEGPQMTTQPGSPLPMVVRERD